MPSKLSIAYKTIGEVVKILNDTEPKEIKITTHTIRFWETQFKQLKPKIINNRRYYDLPLVETLKFIKFLLKSEGLTINGVKKHSKKFLSKFSEKFRESFSGLVSKILTFLFNFISNFDT